MMVFVSFDRKDPVARSKLGRWGVRQDRGFPPTWRVPRFPLKAEGPSRPILRMREWDRNGMPYGVPSPEERAPQLFRPTRDLAEYPPHRRGTIMPPTTDSHLMAALIEDLAERFDVEILDLQAHRPRDHGAPEDPVFWLGPASSVRAGPCPSPPIGPGRGFRLTAGNAIGLTG